MTNIIYAKDYGIFPNTGVDYSLNIFNLINHVNNEGNVTIVFEEGRYDFYPDKAFEKLYYISNHDEDTLKRVTFPIHNTENVTIEGNNSEFYFNGVLIPFVIENSKNITIKNLNIDWVRPLHSQGKIIKADNSSIIVEIEEEYPYCIENNKIFFTGYDFKDSPFLIMEFDSEKVAPAYGSGDNCLGIDRIWGELPISWIPLGENKIEMKGNFGRVPKVGNYFVFRHCKRSAPGIFTKDTLNLKLENLNIYHAGAMGIIAQRCEDLTLKNFNIKLREGTNRVFSTHADATHFVACKGLIKIEDSLFENQLDDAINVHGVYTRVHEILSEDTILADLAHEQQKGNETVRVGEKVAFINNGTLLTYAYNKVKAVDYINKDFMIIKFEDNIPKDISVDHVLENIDCIADLEVRNCTARSNRARGFLITTAGKIIIENNTFSIPGAAIKISGDSNSWYESGAVRNVTIKNNTFIDCNYCEGAWGRAVIDIDPEVEEYDINKGYYHENIAIENNLFKTFNTGIVFGRSVNGLKVKSNKIVRTSTYPKYDSMKCAIELLYSKNVECQNNIYEDEEQIIVDGEVTKL